MIFWVPKTLQLQKKKMPIRRRLLVKRNPVVWQCRRKEDCNFSGSGGRAALYGQLVPVDTAAETVWICPSTAFCPTALGKFLCKFQINANNWFKWAWEAAQPPASECTRYRCLFTIPSPVPLVSLAGTGAASAASASKTAATASSDGD